MDFEMVIFFAFAEIVMDETASDDLKSLRIDALKKVQRSLNHYHHLGYIPELTRAIAEKKCRMIKELPLNRRWRSYFSLAVLDTTVRSLLRIPTLSRKRS